MKKVISSAFIALLGWFLTAPVFGQGQGVSLNKIIAKVDNYYVLRSDLEESYQSYVGQNQTPPQKCQLLESLVINKMMLAKAEIDSVVVDDKIVDSELDQRMQYMAQQFGSEKNIVEAYGKSLEMLKSELRQQVKDQKVAQKMQQKITTDVKVTPRDVRKFFDAIPKDSLPYMPADVEVGQIVRFAKPTKEQKEALRQRLLDIKKRVQAGEDFAKLAKDNSEDVGSAQNGGDLGFAKRGMMVAPFEGAALKMKPNEISDVVESEFGLHLIQLLETRGAEYHARHILLRPDYNRLDLSSPTRYLDSLRTLIVADSVKFDKAAHDFSEDKSTADAGGLIRDAQSGSSRLAMDGSMEYAMFQMLDTMKVGSVSAPLPYRTEDGKSAVRILYFKSKVPPHTADFKLDFEKLQNIVLTNKKNRAIDDWFRKSVADVYISVDPEFQNCRIFGTTQNSAAALSGGGNE
ncbi:MULTISPECIES: peptidylprolyl isomerase [Spirosoma]|uniref:Peptidylprolyl isomerase n=1 Tax=Spirosoma liriopis TaxID=2937440 RepID=A0ABT0HPW9_9BACT|nr:MULTISPECIES: peptidylprolyl isomerase [Spirosoma]MCK8494223.1 peptidylprolyl isomerase [Spirosoma liriopis]UHG89235.1 peptidylprolyl isomerase [Spirosoma oryzicola]